jgi:hypothetical protein
VELRWQFDGLARAPKITVVQRVRLARSATAPSAAIDSSPLSPLAASVYHRPADGIAPTESYPRELSSEQYDVIWPGLVIDGAGP